MSRRVPLLLAFLVLGAGAGAMPASADDPVPPSCAEFVVYLDNAEAFDCARELREDPSALGAADAARVAAERVADAQGVPLAEPAYDGLLVGGLVPWDVTALGTPRVVEPRVAVDGSGRVHVLRSTPDGGIALSRADAGGSEWTHTRLALPSAVLGRHVELAVSDDGTPFVAYRSTSLALDVGRVDASGHVTLVRSHASARDSFALVAKEGVVAYAYTSAADPRTLEVWYGVGAPTERQTVLTDLAPRALDLTANAESLHVAWAEGTRIMAVRLNVVASAYQAVWHDEFRTPLAQGPNVLESPYSTYQLVEPEGRFLVANGLRTDTSNGVMAYVRDFLGGELADKAVRASTRVETIDNDGIALAFRLADGRYLAAMASDDYTTTDAAASVYPDAGKDGIVLVDSDPTAKPYGRWTQDQGARDVADPKDGVELELEYDPLFGVVMTVDGEAAFTLRRDRLADLVGDDVDIVGVGIMSVEQDKPARADRLFVETREAGAFEVVSRRAIVLDTPANGIAVTSTPQGEPVVAWVEATRHTFAAVKRNAAWQPADELPLVQGDITGIDAVGVLVDSASRRGEVWVAVATTVAKPQQVTVPLAPEYPATEVRLYKSVDLDGQQTWAPYSAGVRPAHDTRLPAMQAVPSLAATGVDALAVVYRDVPVADSYWEWIGGRLAG